MKKYITDSLVKEYDNKNNEIKNFLHDLKNIVSSTNYPLEGNCFYHHQTFELYPALYNKQLNLFWCGKQTYENVCEIGFNAGHSCLLLLLGRNIKAPLNFTIFDIGFHLYTRPCFEYIKSKFTNVNFEYFEGDSKIVMPTWIDNHKDLIYKYDLVHVDGGHSEECISNDMKNADLLVRINGIIIIDDTHCEHINSYVDYYLSSGNYIELEVLPTYGYQHRIIQKIK